MNVIDEIAIIANKLNYLDEYSDSLANTLSDLDLKQQHLLHYLEDFRRGVINALFGI